MASTAIKSLEASIDELLVLVRRRMQDTLAMPESARKAEADALVSRITNEAQVLLGYLMKELNAEALAKPKFSTREKRLALFESKIKERLIKTYQFKPDIECNVDAHSPHAKVYGGVAAGCSAATCLGAGLAIGGAPSMLVVGAVAVAVALIVYFIVSHKIERNDGQSQRIIESNIAQLRANIISWLEAVESDFWREVESL